MSIRLWAEIGLISMHGSGCAPSIHEYVLLVSFQPDSPEYRAACKLWDLYLRTKNEFVQRGEYDEDDEDGFDVQDNPAGSTEDEVTQIHNNSSFSIYW